jgi:hypothetical protein
MEIIIRYLVFIIIFTVMFFTSEYLYREKEKRVKVVVENGQVVFYCNSLKSAERFITEKNPVVIDSNWVKP